MSQTQFGYLALLGSPNAGKSTLMNSCLGAKIAGVSAKPQTTRNRIVGILEQGRVQIAILDTPGLQSRISGEAVRLGEFMNKEAWGSVRDADRIAYLIDINVGVTEADAKNLGQLVHVSDKLTVILSKSDRKKKEEVQEIENSVRLKVREIFADHPSVPSVMTLSSKVKASVQAFMETIASGMPEGPHLYESGRQTDRSDEFVSSELIREQIFRNLGQELPYSMAVKVDLLEKDEGICKILATVYVPKEAHKGMVIGKGGKKLREIGSAARSQLERYFSSQVYLELFVKVQPKWFDRQSLIQELVGPGYDA